MKWRKLVRTNLFGLTNSEREDLKLNRFTLSFSGPSKEYEKAFREDYPNAKARLLYRGEERLEIDGIPCLPCERFLEGVVPGEDLP